MALPLLLVALFRYPRLTIAAILLFIGMLAVDTIVEEWGPAASATPGRPRQQQAGPARPGPANRTAKADVPAGYLALYQQAARGSCLGRRRWQLLAAVGKVETNHGRGWAPGWRSIPGIARGTENFAHAGGPMQFIPGTWARYGRGGDRWAARDAIPAAARLLCDHGAPADLTRALWAYNPSSTYRHQVLAQYHRYGG
jgi:hypothetical protein